MSKLSKTSETSINLTFLVLNLVKLLRQFYCLFLCQFFQTLVILCRSINFSYELKNRSKAMFIGGVRGASCSFTPPAFYNFFSKPYIARLACRLSLEPSCAPHLCVMCQLKLAASLRFRLRGPTSSYGASLGY